MDQAGKRLRVAYAIQNVGGIDFRNDVGDTVPVKYTLRGLQQSGHDVTCFRLRGRSVVAINDISQPDRTRDTPLGLSGTRPFRLFESAVRRFQRTLRLPYFALFDLYRFYEACYRQLPEYTLCHEHNGLFCAGGALAAWRLNVPYVLTFSADPLFERALGGRPLRGLRARVATWEAQFTYRVAKKIICVSEPAKRHLVETWKVDPAKIVVMPNGVDIDLFHPGYDPTQIRLELNLGNSPVVGFVGGFQHWHGLDRLVKGFAQVLAEFPCAKLLLVGDGRARGEVQEKVAELGLAESVVITGLIPQDRVPEMLSAIDVAVLPYPRLPKELWFSPLKLYEYLAAGKAVVASRDGQIAEVVRDGDNGLLVEPGNTDALAKAMIRLLNDPAERERLGGNARRQAVEHHSWDHYIRRLEETYWKALGIDAVAQ